MLSDDSVGDLASRLKHALKKRERSAQSLEGPGKLARGHVSRILNRQRKRVRPRALRILAAELAVNYEWLAHGMGEMDDVSGLSGADPPPHRPPRAKKAAMTPNDRAKRETPVDTEAADAALPAQSTVGERLELVIRLYAHENGWSEHDINFARLFVIPEHLTTKQLVRFMDYMKALRRETSHS